MGMIITPYKTDVIHYTVPITIDTYVCVVTSPLFHTFSNQLQVEGEQLTEAHIDLDLTMILCTLFSGRRKSHDGHNHPTLENGLPFLGLPECTMNIYWRCKSFDIYYLENMFCFLNKLRTRGTTGHTEQILQVLLGGKNFFQ